LKIETAVCDLSGWIEDNLPRWEKTLGKKIDVSLPEGGGPQVRMDARFVGHLIDNLVRNVRKHAPQSACRLTASPAPSLLISDDGPGLPDNVLLLLNRGEPVLDVSGVGLNLCQKIAKICGLKLRFINRTSGGLDAEILFPSST
jgi:signal transduction histidine kinase